MARRQFDRQAALVDRPRSRAELLQAGVPPHQIRNRWRRTSYGFYVPLGTAPTERNAQPIEPSPDVSHKPDLSDSVRAIPLSAARRILEAAPLVPPDGAISGWAAAFAHGADTLDGYGFTGGGREATGVSPYQPVAILVPPALHRRRMPGVTYLRAAVPSAERTERAGVPVTTPARAAFDAARLAGSLGEAVASLDACLFHRLVRIDEFQRYVESAPPLLGVRLVRRALGLADPAARNPWESRLRVFCGAEAGLTSPQANRPVFTIAGDFLGIPDLLFEEAGCAVEFDGQDHRRRQQHRADNVREERLEACGLIVVRVDSLDLLYHRAELLGRLRSAYARGLSRDRSRDDWTLTEPDWWLAQTDPTSELDQGDLDWLAER